MKTLFLSCITILGLNFSALSQSPIMWADDLNITQADLKGTPSAEADNDDMQSYTLATTLEFGYNMNSYVFAFKKNFNKYVTAQYYPNDSWLEDGESSELLLELLNLEFDIVELFARRYRQKLFAAKNLLSSSNFFVEEYDVIQKEYTDYTNNMNDVIATKTEEEISVYVKSKAKEVNNEIADLYEYCRSCKLLKKKKR